VEDRGVQGVSAGARWCKRMQRQRWTTMSILPYTLPSPGVRTITAGPGQILAQNNVLARGLDRGVGMNYHGLPVE